MSEHDLPFITPEHIAVLKDESEGWEGGRRQEIFRDALRWLKAIASGEVVVKKAPPGPPDPPVPHKPRPYA